LSHNKRIATAFLGALGSGDMDAVGSFLTADCM